MPLLFSKQYAKHMGTCRFEKKHVDNICLTHLIRHLQASFCPPPQHLSGTGFSPVSLKLCSHLYVFGALSPRPRVAASSHSAVFLISATSCSSLEALCSIPALAHLLRESKQQVRQCQRQPPTTTGGISTSRKRTSPTFSTISHQ